MIDRRDGLSPLLDDWRRLATARGNAFITPEWYLAALDVFHQDATPGVAVARAAGGIVRGLLPLVRTGPHRAEPPAGRFADLVDLVCEPGSEDDVARSLAPALARHLGARCELVLGRVDAGADWWGELARAWPRRMTVITQPEETLPYADLDGVAWEDYLASRSGQLRNQLKRKMRSLQRDHEVRLRIVAGADELAAGLDSLFALHDARWAGRRESSSLTGDVVRAFQRRFAVAANDQGWARLHLLEVDGEAVAAWYGWRLGDRYSYYQAGFDPAWSRYSVGFLLLSETIRAAVAEGASEYDLLLGDEAFKQRFATGERLGRRVMLTPPISRARLAASGRKVARAGMRALPEQARNHIRSRRGPPSA